MIRSIIYERNYEQYFNEYGNHGRVHFESKKSREDNIECIFDKECLRVNHVWTFFDKDTMTLSTISTSGYWTTETQTEEETTQKSEYKKRVFIEIMPPSELPKGLKRILTEAGFKELL